MPNAKKLLGLVLDFSKTCLDMIQCTLADTARHHSKLWVCLGISTPVLLGGTVGGVKNIAKSQL